MSDNESVSLEDEIRVVHLTGIPTKTIQARELEDIAAHLAELTHPTPALVMPKPEPVVVKEPIKKPVKAPIKVLIKAPIKERIKAPVKVVVPKPIIVEEEEPIRSRSLLGNISFSCGKFAGALVNTFNEGKRV